MRKLFLVAAIMILMIVFYMFTQGFFVVKQKEQAPKDQTPVTGTKPAAIHNGPVGGEGQASVKSVADSPARTQKIELQAADKQLYNLQQVNATDFTYSISKEKQEKQLMPGISYKSDKSINIKIPDQEEIVRLRRVDTYRAGEYQVLWEKKY